MAVLPKYPATGERFFAGVIDGLVFFPISICDIFLSGKELPLLINIAWAIVSDLCFSIYSVLMHSKYGQTLGKMAMKIKRSSP